MNFFDWNKPNPSHNSCAAGSYGAGGPSACCVNCSLHSLRIFVHSTRGWRAVELQASCLLAEEKTWWFNTRYFFFRVCRVFFWLDLLEWMFSPILCRLFLRVCVAHDMNEGYGIFYFHSANHPFGKENNLPNFCLEGFVFCVVLWKSALYRHILEYFLTC